MADISLLPEEMRKKGDTQKKASGAGEDLTFHVPQTDIGAGLGPGATLTPETKKPGFFAWLFGTKATKGTAPVSGGSGTSQTQQKSPMSSVGSMIHAERVALSSLKSPAQQPVVVVPPNLPIAPAATPKMHVPPAELAITQRPSVIKQTAPLSIRPNMSGQQPATTPTPQRPTIVPSAVRNERRTETSPRPVAPVSAPAVPLVHDVAARNAPGLRVSLIPTMRQEGAGFVRNQWRKIIALSIGLLAILFVATVAIVWYVHGQKGETEALIIQGRTAQESFVSMRQSLDSARLFAKQVQTLRVLLDGHLAWSHFFTLLEKNTHQDIAYVQIATDGLNTVLLQADARSYRAIAEQVQHLSEVPGIEEVHVSGITTELGPTGALKGVHLLLTIRFDPRLIAAENESTPGL
ncbi:hypothetical protein KBD18_00485 [Patescibacteria group bacterium]|nr:hypothetical protein [Patescibacteria group bacterium]